MLNLSTLKNVITGKSSPPPVVAPSVTAAPDGVKAEVEKKHREMFQGKTKAQVQRLRAELDTAALAVKQAERTVGERRTDDLDITEATEELRQAGDRVRALQAALNFAIQKDEAALAALKDAERQAAIEKEVDALAYLKLTVAPKVDDALDQLERVTAELAIALDQARAMGAGGKHQTFLTEARLELQRFTNLALDPVTGLGKMPSRMMKYTRWSDCIPHPNSARTKPRS